jgi:hypothetical protein
VRLLAHERFRQGPSAAEGATLSSGHERRHCGARVHDGSPVEIASDHDADATRVPLLIYQLIDFVFGRCIIVQACRERSRCSQAGDIALSCGNLKKRGMIFRWPRWAPILVVLALAAFAIVAIGSPCEPVLRAAGWALVVDEPVAPSDIIVLSLDSAGAGALEAADLVQSGISKRVAVFMDPPSGEDFEFMRRGLPYEDAGARQIRQLRSLGVTDVVQISRVEGTEGEGQVIPPWCDEHHLQSIVVVATKDHSRRLRRVLDRVMKGHRTHVTVHAARYSSFDPDRWWETRGGVRTEIIEFQKLLFDVILHPTLY